MKMKGRVAVVTGAARGIGLAIAERLAAEGAVTICADIDEDGALATAREIVRRGGSAKGYRCDVTNANEIERLMAEAEEQGGPHALICNAGIQIEQSIDLTSVDEWDRVLNVNLRGPFLCARSAIPRMRELGGGTIVNMASVSGFWVEPMCGAYCASKAGVINLTRAIAIENGRHNIRCNCICPGYVDTELARQTLAVYPDPSKARERIERMHALGRFAAPAEVAAMALFLCSDESSFCTGQQFIIDGGLTAGVTSNSFS